MKKRLVSLVLVLLLALTFGLVACNEDEGDSGYAGKYYEYNGETKDPNSWIELKSDGTWVSSAGLTGTYTVSGTVLSVTMDEMTLDGTIENGVFVLEGITYKKDAPPAEPPAGGKMTKAQWETVMDDTFEAWTKADANFKTVMLETGYDEVTTIIVGNKASNTHTNRTYYHELDGEDHYQYQQNEGVWEKIGPVDYNSGGSLAERLAIGVNILEMAEYDSLTYADGKYSFNATEGGATYLVQFTITNGLVSKMEISVEGYSMTVTYTYGGQSVTLPTVG